MTATYDRDGKGERRKPKADEENAASLQPKGPFRVTVIR